MRRSRRILLVLGGLLALSQLVRFEHANPPVESDVATSPAVKTILKRACYDCHSHETSWPWYADVAPISWLVTHDVNGGRDSLNFSRWDSYDEKRREKKMKETVDEVNEREMPPWYYTILHPHAELSNADRAVLAEWARTQK
jgi:hypothetical protein